MRRGLLRMESGMKEKQEAEAENPTSQTRNVFADKGGAEEAAFCAGVNAIAGAVLAGRPGGLRSWVYVKGTAVT